MLLSNWTTVDRVEKLSEGAAYCLLEVSVTAVTAFGRVRAELEWTRLTAVVALLATAPAVDRRASISRYADEWRVFVRGEEFPQLLKSRDVVFEVQPAALCRLDHERRGTTESLNDAEHYLEK